MRRREFLRIGLGAGGAFIGHAAARAQTTTGRTGPTIALVADTRDPVVATPQVRWALEALAAAFADRGATIARLTQVSAVPSGSRLVVAAGRQAALAVPTLQATARSIADAPEALGLAPMTIDGRTALFACGADSRGLTYALLDLVDRARHSSSLDAALAMSGPITERPANAVRSVMRQFACESLDTPWFHDRDMWPAYLGMLAGHRFNRLHLGFGLGYDAMSGVVDSDLVFAYPFLLAVAGYDVRVSHLADADRDRNLATLRFISDAAVAHGLDFQIGLWMHGYQLTNSPRASYIVEGLTPETHAGYCRDGLTALLSACPSISAVALRIHGESGVAEGSYDFWSTVFDGVARAGRKIEIDLHAKGLDQTMVERALATGMPVNVSPKFWAEHLGLPYHQAAIRDLEMPVAGRAGRGLMTLSEGTRSFTRYGYADFLREGRPYTVRHRVWAGTRKVLASGDPLWTAAYGRAFAFCGSTGADVMEPLSCRGRRGTASSSTRIGYTTADLAPHWDWEKFSDWYRTWGRLMYNPDAPADVFRREFAEDEGAEALAASLAQASRVLPLVTTSHLPSAACDAYWPEIYWNQPLVEMPGPNPYGDTPAPKTFANVSPLDPQLFSRMTDAADDLLSGTPNGKYSPIDVAAWLEGLAAGARRDLARAGQHASTARRRLTVDIEIQAGLGEFFAARFRSGVLHAVFVRTGDRRALEASLARYRAARSAWSALSETAARVYASDLAASDKVSARGAWPDRLPAIDQDIDRLAQQLASTAAKDDPRVPAIITEALATPERPAIACTHQPPASFRRGEAVALAIKIEGVPPRTARLWYRRVNQAERYESVAMTAGAGGALTASIPASYTDAPFALQYYFEFTGTGRRAWLYPGLNATLSNQPYVTLR